ELLCVFGDLGGAGQERPLAVGRDDGELSNRAAHTPPANHLTCNLGQLLDVGLRAGRGLVEDELLGCTSTESDLDLRQELATLVAVAIGLRRGECDTEGQTARDDRDLAHRI